MPFSFHRTRDFALIQKILCDPRLWPRMVNDDAPPIETFHVSDNPRIVPVLVRDRGEAVGLFLLVPEGDQAEIHVAFLPDAWGRTVEATKRFLDWTWTSTRFHRLVGPVPSYNRLALRLALQSGFEPFDRQPAGTKHGKRFDHIFLQVERPSP